jgi:hypothetical protein
MRFVVVFRVRYYQDYHISEDGMAGAFSTQGRSALHTKSWSVNHMQGENLKDVGVGGRIILKCQKE